MELHKFSDTIQDLCHEGHSLAQIHFSVGDVSYILKSIDVINGTVIFRLQAEPQRAVHDGFLGLGRQKSSKSQEKT
jgi:hypothetical protein